MAEANQVLHSSTHSGFRKQGVLSGLFAVYIGDVIFALIYPIALGIVSGFRAQGFLAIYLSVAVISWVTGLVVSIIPGVLGGLCLALLLNQDAVKGQLTSQKASLKGTLVGALAGIISSLISVFFLFSSITSDSVFSYGINGETGVVTIIKLALITVLPIAIAIFMGAWSGRRLARYFSNE